MSERIIVGFVKEIFKNSDTPLSVKEVNEKLYSIGMKLDHEKVRRCIVNLHGRKFIETAVTDFRNGCTYKIKQPKPKEIVIVMDDNRSEYEKMKFPIPSLTGTARVFNYFGEKSFD